MEPAWARSGIDLRVEAGPSPARRCRIAFAVVAYVVANRGQMPQRLKPPAKWLLELGGHRADDEKLRCPPPANLAEFGPIFQRRVYREVLVPALRPDEIESEELFLGSLASGDAIGIVLAEPAGNPVSAIIG